MAPGLTTEVPYTTFPTKKVLVEDEVSTGPQYPKPLKKTGILDDNHVFRELTPIIGREYSEINLVDDVINAPNADELIREISITIAERGVVFFRAQDNMTDDIQKAFIDRLGHMGGKPADHGLHIHPIFNKTQEHGKSKDNQISTISSNQLKRVFRNVRGEQAFALDNAKWHTDIQFEPVTSDYTCLRMGALPSTGGDTLWASGYEMYDRLSPAYRKFLEGLTVTCDGGMVMRYAMRNPETMSFYEGERGAPLNVGKEMSAVHPFIRTNPITGWKSVFAAGLFPKKVNELYHKESEDVLNKMYNMIIENHDLQIRWKWQSVNDMAIWDNRSTFHCATFDYNGLGDRFGTRAVGCGEKPYLDPNSVSRAEALGELL